MGTLIVCLGFAAPGRAGHDAITMMLNAHPEMKRISLWCSQHEDH